MDRAMVFGKYCLLERISVGGMAEVFRAKPLPAYQSDKMLALKRILPHLAEDDEFITMFVDEAKLTVQLEHPNIVETYELGDFQSSYYILMEYIAGEDVLELQKRLRQNRRIMSVVQACYVAEKVARGLHYAHTATDDQGRPFNIIHRDVSPQNIRLTWDGRVKLIDFGIAKAAVQRTKTQVGVLKGKFGYMSPEQVRGEEIDHRSDVFALGTTLWEMLTNRRLFNGENEYETLQMVKHPDIPRPSEKNSQVPPAVDDIVMRALHEDREQRFQSARELGDALLEFLTGLRTPFTQEHLSEWMAETFSEELAEERRKRELYREIKSTDDVRWFNREYADEPPEEEEEAGESLVHDEDAPEEQIWDPDFAPEEGEDVDQESFAANHTRVAAGGFDPEEFEDEEDELIAVDDADIIEVDDGEATVDATPSEVGLEESGAPGDERDDRAVRDAEGHAAAGESPAGDRPGGSGPGAPGGAGPTGEIGAGEQRGPGLEEEPSEVGDRAEPEESVGDGEIELPKVLFAAAAIVAVVALTAAVGYLLFVEGAGAGVGEASVVVELKPEPVEAGTILVDGEPRAKRAPAAVGKLAPGKHTVEVRYPNYQSVQRQVDLGPGELKNLEVELEREGPPTGRIRVRVSDTAEKVRLFVDGERRSKDFESGAFTVETGLHLVEAVKPGARPWARVLRVGEGTVRRERVEFQSNRAVLRVDADETSEVEVDGEARGETPATIREMSPTELHRVVLESTESYHDWESQVGFPELGQRVLSVSYEEPPETYDDGDFGSLTVSTGGDWWNVLVDGRPTGLITPIESEEKIPVREGDRTVTLRRGDQVHEFDVEIQAGDTTSIVEKLPFEWKGTGS